MTINLATRLQPPDITVVVLRMGLNLGQEVSDKTSSNIKSALHDFWKWILDREEITMAQFPKSPHCNFELGFRNTVSKEEQRAILSEIHRISYHVNCQRIQRYLQFIGIKIFKQFFLRVRPLIPLTGGLGY